MLKDHVAECHTSSQRVVRTTIRARVETPVETLIGTPVEILTENPVEVSFRTPIKTPGETHEPGVSLPPSPPETQSPTPPPLPSSCQLALRRLKEQYPYGDKFDCVMELESINLAEESPGQTLAEPSGSNKVWLPRIRCLNCRDYPNEAEAESMAGQSFEFRLDYFKNHLSSWQHWNMARASWD
ncbi:hypothetical protein CCMA1212_003704 [Trichoderma ghanense]|uniref:Uncharacterized protein n=1 Tax=Trichoderma ghanense TaxID=65468 RepID=A0ABY2H770_9HYPO